MEPDACHIQAALGRHETCPGESCPFWRDGACVVAGLRADLPASAELAELLLALRTRLGGGEPSLPGLLPPGLRE